MRSLHLALAVALLVAVPPPNSGADEGCAGVPDGTFCPDDLDPCTTDVCTLDSCRHDEVPNRITCDPVVDAYRRTLGLTVLITETAGLAATITLPDDQRLVIEDALTSAQVTLTRASDALAGRLAIPPPAGGETLAQARSRAAFGIVRESPARVRAGLVAVRTPAVQATGSIATDLARRIRFLYRSLTKLKRELRRLQRVSGVLAR